MSRINESYNYIVGCVSFRDMDPLVKVLMDNYQDGAEVRHSSGKLFVRFKNDFKSLRHFRYDNWSVTTWGIIGSVENVDDPVREIVNAVASENYSFLSSLTGSFIVILFDHFNETLVIVSDPLSTKPFFVRRHAYGVVFGSDVRLLAKLGLSSTVIDESAVRAWIYFGFNPTCRTLFRDLEKLPPCSVTAFNVNEVISKTFRASASGSVVTNQSDAADLLYSMVYDSTRALTDPLDDLVVSLSGGFDSRLLAGILEKHRGLRGVQLVTVASDEAESILARQVGDRLGAEVEVLKVSGSLWDAYADPFHFTPDGFPTTKNVCHLVADAKRGTPIINGYLGDIIIRDSLGQKFNKLYHDKSLLSFARFFSQNKALSVLMGQIKWLSLEKAALNLMMADFPPSLMAIVGLTEANLYLRQRSHIVNNFVEHLELAEAVLPLLQGAMIDFRLAHPNDFFNSELYKLIFQRHLPNLDKIIHSSDYKLSSIYKFNYSSLLSRLSEDIMKHKLINGSALPFLRWSHVFSRLAGYRLGRESCEYVVVRVNLLYMLEREVEEMGQTLNWKSIFSERA